VNTVFGKIYLAFLLFCLFPSLGSTAFRIVPPTQPIPRTFFGLHIHRVTGKTPWPPLAVPTWRLWDAHVTWPDLEPSKGQWQFDTLDKYVTLAEQHNTQILLPLAVTPQWASARPNVKSGWQKPGFAAEPKDMNDWRSYVRQVVSRYKGRIVAYEIWNEPNLQQYWIGNTDQLVAMTKDAHDIISSIDPAAILVSPSATTIRGGILWLADFLNKGGGRYVDVIGYHFYVFPQPPEAILPLIEKVKQTLKDNGAGNKPIWDTELGWAEPKPFPSNELAAAYLARSFILSWAAGIQRVYWYAWDNHNWVSLETVEADDKTPTPAGQAYGTIQNWMVGASMDGCDKSDDGTWTCHLHRGNDSQWIVWNADATKSFTVPVSWHISQIALLLQGTQRFHDASIEVGPIPELLTQGDAPAPPTSLSASPRM
jgi:GH35 family endo-1,4-beta-xylanase